jgi:uncharacterized protein
MDWRKLFRWNKKPLSEPLSVVPKDTRKYTRGEGLSRALAKAQSVDRPKYPIKIPVLPPNVVPEGQKSGIAMDTYTHQFPAAFFDGSVEGFPGYTQLSFLATRAEYRAMAGALSTELTREWITLNSSETGGDATKDKVTKLTKKLEEIGLQQVIQRAAEHDALFGRAQIFIDIKGQENKRALPLKVSPKTIAKDSFLGVKTVEAIWTTPVSYNAMDPAAKDFYKPSAWFMLGQRVHSDRLLTIITRPLPDMLKPAFNFGGMSLSQLAEPYVNNWLRTRQSVADIINNFSITALKTSMDEVLTDGEDGDDLFKRAALFTATRSNKGLMILDKEREDLVQINAPLGGLHELQAQVQEHMCAVSRLPAIILTGISPGGLNASSDSEIKTFYDWISAQQEAYWRAPIETILQILQLSMYGAIDPDITFSFDPLFQMSEKELSEIRTADATAAQTYVGMGAVAAEEVREKLARDPESGFQGLDLSMVITDPNGDEDDEDDYKAA